MLGYKRTKIGAIIGAILGICFSIVFMTDTGQFALGMMLGISLMSSIITAFIFWITYAFIPPTANETHGADKPSRKYSAEELEKIQQRIDELRYKKEYNYVPTGMYSDKKPTNRLNYEGQKIIEKEFNMDPFDLSCLVRNNQLKDTLADTYRYTKID